MVDFTEITYCTELPVNLFSFSNVMEIIKTITIVVGLIFIIRRTETFIKRFIFDKSFESIKYISDNKDKKEMPLSFSFFELFNIAKNHKHYAHKIYLFANEILEYFVEQNIQHDLQQFIMDELLARKHKDIFIKFKNINFNFLHFSEKMDNISFTECDMKTANEKSISCKNVDLLHCTYGGIDILNGNIDGYIKTFNDTSSQ